MDFCELQENLRQLLWQRVRAGELSGLRLARQTGFRQPHISNFLNGKRGLSLDGLDKVLSALQLSVIDLLSCEEINRRARGAAAGSRPVRKRGAGGLRHRRG